MLVELLPTSEVLRALSIPGVMLGLFILGMLRGWLRTDRAVQEIRADRTARVEAAEADRDARVAEAKTSADARVLEAKEQAQLWREAHRQSEQAREIQAEALRTALDVARESEEGWDLFRIWLNREISSGSTRTTFPTGDEGHGS